MDSCDRPRAGLPEWTGVVDQRGLLLHRELAMARCPLGRQVDDGLPDGAELLRSRDAEAGRDPGQRARPGKRW
jgi:hypothetical protein